jgi:hypothetical protein
MADERPPQPGERRLDRPPSERYGPAPGGPAPGGPGPGGPAPGGPAPTTTEASATKVDAAAAGEGAGASSGSLWRGLAYAAIVAAVSIAAIVVLGGVLAFSAGLLVVAAVAGRAIGLALDLGGGAAVRPPTRTWLAVGIALATVGFGQLGLWWYAGTEGGVLGPLDYLGEAFGVLVPLELGLAAAFAWWAAR